MFAYARRRSSDSRSATDRERERERAVAAAAARQPDVARYSDAGLRRVSKLNTLLAGSLSNPLHPASQYTCDSLRTDFVFRA